VALNPLPAAPIRLAVARPQVAPSPLPAVPIRLAVEWPRAALSPRLAVPIRLAAGRPRVAPSPLPAVLNPLLPAPIPLVSAAQPPAVVKPHPVVLSLPPVVLNPLLPAPIPLVSAAQPPAVVKPHPVVLSRPPPAPTRSAAGRPQVALSLPQVVPNRPRAAPSPPPPARIRLAVAPSRPPVAPRLRVAAVRSSRKAAGQATPSLELPAAEKNATSGVGNPLTDAVPGAHFVLRAASGPATPLSTMIRYTVVRQ
jgi:hypothetical protein